MDRIDRDDVDRSRLDQAGIGPHATTPMDLVPLRKLDGVRIAEGDPDIRGWEVTTLGGAKVGVVDELLVDRPRGEVVMFDVDLAGSDRHTLVPIRAAQIDRVRRVVVVDSADLNGPADLAAVSRSSPAPVVTGRAEGDRVRLSDARVADVKKPGDTAEETVVERRPVVYEEVVVRRRVADPSESASEGRADADR